MGFEVKHPLGKMELITDTELAANATSVDITGISLGTDSNKFVLFIDGYNNEANTRAIQLQINGDSTLTNYYTTELYNNAGTGTYLTSNSTSVGYITASVQAQNVAWICIDAAGYARWTSFGGSGTLTVPEPRIYQGVKQNATVTDITQLTIVHPTASGLKAGTRIRLYRLVV